MPLAIGEQAFNHALWFPFVRFALLLSASLGPVCFLSVKDFLQMLHRILMKLRGGGNKETIPTYIMPSLQHQHHFSKKQEKVKK